ncbi:MAG: CHAD domain-containing protein [Acidobacteriia bacterium]|nr:CHAD domain-containing protein [Terriglobia bacterium]
MALTIPLPTGIAAKSIGLEVWMDRVLERANLVRRGWDADDVHDLRVALRRCRTMADALSEVNPGPGWRKLKKASGDLFRALGDLRDAQVERSWVKKLGPPRDPVRKQLLRTLAGQERLHREKAERALDQFDRKAWKKLTRKLASKARFFPMESVVFQRLALAQLNTAGDLFQKARKSRSAIAWHRLRIGIKRFRYIVENFLPQRSEVWGDDLRRMQDLLGDVHDLDVLRGRIRRSASKLSPAIQKEWIDRIDAKRKALLQEFLQISAGPNSPWLTWRAGFQWGHALVAAPFPSRRTA